MGREINLWYDLEFFIFCARILCNLETFWPHSIPRKHKSQTNAHKKIPQDPERSKWIHMGNAFIGSPADRKVANSSNLSEESVSGCNATGFCPLHHYSCLWGRSWVQMMTEQSPHLQKRIHHQVLPWELCMWASPPDEFSLDKRLIPGPSLWDFF